jgi:hypothetical protein
MGMKPKVTLNVKQTVKCHAFDPDTVVYVVVKAINTVSPKVGDELTERNVKDEIYQGVTVNVT